MSREVVEEEGMVKGLQTHLVPREMEARGVGERERRWTHFYTACVLPEASSHSKQAVIFPETHLKCK